MHTQSAGAICNTKHCFLLYIYRYIILSNPMEPDVFLNSKFHILEYDTDILAILLTTPARSVLVIKHITVSAIKFMAVHIKFMSGSIPLTHTHTNLVCRAFWTERNNCRITLTHSIPNSPYGDIIST